MIRYDRLWATMEAKGLTQYRLIKQYGFSAGQIGRLKKNMHVSTHTLDTLCNILACNLEEIVEYLPEGSPAEAPPLPAEIASPASEAPKDASPKVSIPKDSIPAKVKKAASSKPDKGADKPKKTGKQKKGDKKATKGEKKSKEGKKNK